jgi:hypothetical protein
MGPLAGRLLLRAGRLAAGAAATALAASLPLPPAPRAPGVPESALVRILTPPPERAFACTGWWAGPAPRMAPQGEFAYYITAGHCPIPQAVSAWGRTESATLVASVRDPGTDATVGIAPLAGPARFLRLSSSLPAPGETAAAAGWPLGRYTVTAVTYIGSARGRLLFRSPTAIRRGYSGAPIVSTRTGLVLGMLVGTERGNATSIEAIPAPRIALLLALAAPSLRIPAPSGSAIPPADSTFVTPRSPGR